MQGRVCGVCGMGMLLRCSADALPGSGAAFLIATVHLRVTAISQSAECIFGHESAVLGRSLLDLVASPMGETRLSRTVAQAATRPRESVDLPVRATGERARLTGMLTARISTCGPPRAALITVEPSDFGRKR